MNDDKVCEICGTQLTEENTNHDELICDECYEANEELEYGDDDE